MTIGIYKLVFNNTDKLYFGQSIDIEKRYINHLSEMRQGISSKKLQEAYFFHGEPSIVIEEECCLEDLDIKEQYYISLYSSVEKGFNTTPGGHNNYGANHGTAKYPKDTYLEILFYLANTSLTILEIASITETTKSVVMHISMLARHSWLKEADPENYNKLIILRNSGNKKCALAQGIQYPPIISPTGEKYTVTNTRKFSEEHNIPNGSLCGVLKGTQRYVKGWRLETTPPVPNASKVLSPQGEIVEIPYRGTVKFCETYGLTVTCIRDLLKGKQKSHKGWTLMLK